MSRNDSPTDVESLANACRTLARNGVTHMDARDGDAEITLAKGVTMQISLDEATRDASPERDDAATDTDARDGDAGSETGESEAEGVEKADFVCSCGATFDGRQAALGHTGGAGDGHTLAREAGAESPDGEGSPEGTDANADDAPDDARVTPSDVTPSELTETFAKDNAEALTDGTGYDANAANAGKAVAREHGDAWSAAFGHEQECAGEGCDRIIPRFKPSEGATCPMHDASDVPADGASDAPEGESANADAKAEVEALTLLKHDESVSTLEEAKEKLA
jgi:hypothetical protein